MSNLLHPALSREEADLSGSAIDAFAQTFGSRSQILQTLLIGSGSPDVDKVLSLLEEPTYAGWSLRKICTFAGISLADLFRAFRAALIARGQIDAQAIVTRELCGVAADLMRRAQPHEEPCDVCFGQPPADDEKACRYCHGTGHRRILPSLDRQKVALELAQLLQSKAGISLTQNTLVAGAAPKATTASGPGSFVDLQSAIAEARRPRRLPAAAPAPIVEATVIEADPDEAAP